MNDPALPPPVHVPDGFIVVAAYDPAELPSCPTPVLAASTTVLTAGGRTAPGPPRARAAPPRSPPPRSRAGPVPAATALAAAGGVALRHAGPPRAGRAEPGSA